MKVMALPHISIVCPVFRADDCIEELCRRLKLAIASITDDFEIILIDDRSPDNSWEVIQREVQKDPRVRGIRLAKNFGQHRAITAGLDIAKGDWVVVLDCDLQDPPEEIPRLYSKALEGYEIVVAQFEERSESNVRQKVSQSFWGLLSWLAGISFDHRIGNYRIMSRRVVENFRNYREQLRLLGGITALMGFTSTTLIMNREERFAGETSYTFKKLFLVAVDIAMAYSDKPLKISVIAGVIISGLAIFCGIIILLLALSNLIDVPGWASVMISLYLIGGLIIANLGVIGYYIGKTFDETKRRPLYIIENMAIRPYFNEAKLSQQRLGRVIWITGLSGAGKSTLAHEVVARLRSEHESVVMLDGDELREIFGASATNSQNHNRDSRLALAMQYAQLCRMIAGQGLTVVVATISLFHEVHAWNRDNLPGYFEVYLKVPVEELRRRDPKGIYRRFDAGELINVAGLDLVIDEPVAADWVVEFLPWKTVSTQAEELIYFLNKGHKDDPINKSR
jgi:adenylylsulfate kinase-like enzyme/glycosyltransferase involved in cell wall biosynthesis